MKDIIETLDERLAHIWKTSNFSSLIKAFKRPPVLIKKDRILYSEGDILEHLYFIQDGYVKVYRLSKDGKETIAHLYGPGNILGLRAILSKNKISRYNAESLTVLKLISINYSELYNLAAKYPVFIIDLTHFLMNALEHTEQTIERLVATDVATRIAYFFVDVAIRFGKTDKTKVIVLPLLFTHQKIAEFIGSSRETVTLSIEKLEKAGVISIEKGKVTIPSLARLNRYAQINKNR